MPTPQLVVQGALSQCCTSPQAGALPALSQLILRIYGHCSQHQMSVGAATSLTPSVPLPQNRLPLPPLGVVWGEEWA